MTKKKKQANGTMYYAEMETSHFTFRAFAPSYREALDALRSGLRKHCKNYGIPAGPLLKYAGEGDEGGDINVLEMKSHGAYCDWDAL